MGILLIHLAYGLDIGMLNGDLFGQPNMFELETKTWNKWDLACWLGILLIHLACGLDIGMLIGDPIGPPNMFELETRPGSLQNETWLPPEWDLAPSRMKPGSLQNETWLTPEWDLAMA